MREPLLRNIRRSWFVKWLRVRLRQKAEHERSETRDLREGRSDLPSWPDYERLREAGPITEADLMGRAFANDPLAPIYQEALALTGFGLDQFQARAERDGAQLFILATHDVKRYGARVFARLAALAAARDIPVIDQSDYIERHGAAPADAHWPTDGHWNAAGHRWAAQALAEHLMRHEGICSRDHAAAPPGCACCNSHRVCNANSNAPVGCAAPRSIFRCPRRPPTTLSTPPPPLFAGRLAG